MSVPGPGGPPPNGAGGPAAPPHPAGHPQNRSRSVLFMPKKQARKPRPAPGAAATGSSAPPPPSKPNIPQVKPSSTPASPKPSVPKPRTYHEFDIVSLGNSQVAMRSLAVRRMTDLRAQGVLGDDENGGDVELDEAGQPVRDMLNIMHFAGASHQPPDIFSLNQPIMLNRKDPTYVPAPPPPVDEQPKDVLAKKVTPYTSQAEIDELVAVMAAQTPNAPSFNIPIFNEDDTPIFDSKTGEQKVREVKNPNLIAPGPSAMRSAAIAQSSRSSSTDRSGKKGGDSNGRGGGRGGGNGGGGRGGGRAGRRFEEKVKMRASNRVDWQEVNKEKLPWVLEEAGPSEADTVAAAAAGGGQQGVNSAAQKWVGRREGGGEEDTSGWVAMIFCNNEIVLRPIDRAYRFEPRRKIEKVGSDMVSRLLENQIQGRQMPARWMLRQQEDPLVSVDDAGLNVPSSNQGATMPPLPEASNRPPADLKPDVKRETKPARASTDMFASMLGRRGATSFAVKLENLQQSRDVKPRIKRERWEDDDSTARGRAGGPGIERMEGEDLDVEDTGAQSDEEGFAVGEDEEAAQRELLARQREEQLLANRNVGVLEGGSDDESDDDIFGEQAEKREAEYQEKRQRAKLRRKLRKEAEERGEDPPPDDSDDDEDFGELSDLSEPEDVKPNITADADVTTSPDGSGTQKSRRPTASPSPAPYSRANSPHGTRSQSPAAGFGHQLTAARALSPGRSSRAGTPSSSTSSGGNKSNRKRKGGDHATAPPEGSGFGTNESSERFSKKHRPHTDSGQSTPLSSENAAYLPKPDPDGDAAASTPSASSAVDEVTSNRHKNRVKKKQRPQDSSMSPPPLGSAPSLKLKASSSSPAPGGPSSSATPPPTLTEAELRRFIGTQGRTLSDIANHFQKKLQDKEASGVNRQVLRDFTTKQCIREGKTFRLR